MSGYVDMSISSARPRCKLTFLSPLLGLHLTCQINFSYCPRVRSRFAPGAIFPVSALRPVIRTRPNQCLAGATRFLYTHGGIPRGDLSLFLFGLAWLRCKPRSGPLRLPFFRPNHSLHLCLRYKLTHRSLVLAHEDSFSPPVFKDKPLFPSTHQTVSYSPPPFFLCSIFLKTFLAGS